MSLNSYNNLYKEDFINIEPTLVNTLNPGFFKYNKDLKIIICSNCSLTLLNRKDIKKHLIKNHLEYFNTTSNIKEIIANLEALEITSYLELNNIPNNTYYFKDLPLSFNSYKCFKCDFITTSYKRIREHLIKVENIKNKDKTKRKDIISNIPITILFPSLNKGIFIPKLPKLRSSSIILSQENIKANSSKIYSSSSNSSSSSSIDSNTNTNINKDNSSLILSYINRKEYILQEAKEEEANNLNNKALSSFLKNSRFNKFLENKNIKDILELIEPLKKEDIILEKAFYYTNKLAYKISNLIPNIIRSIRIDLKRDNIVTNFLNTKDFIELETKTKKEYYKVFNNLIVFILRLYLIKNKEIYSANKEYIIKEIKTLVLLDKYIKELLLILREEDIIEELITKVEEYIILIFFELLKIPIKLTTLKEYSLFKNPTIIFFILNCLDKNTYRYKEESTISNLASKVIYNSKLFFIGYLNLLETQNPNINLEEEYNKCNNTLLKSNSLNYLGEIINIRNYTLKISKESLSKNRPILELDPNRILVYNKEYNISSLRSLFKDLIIRLEYILFKDLIGLEINSLPKINLSTIKDSNLLSNIDYFILDNPSLVDYKDYLPKLLLNPKSSLYKRYISSISSSNKINYKISNINKFYTTRKEFINLLALAIYLTSSSPLRGEELVNITYKNTRDNIRNIIFNKEEELILITTNYYKSYNITRKDKENLRFLNKDLSTILIYYLVYIIPLYYYFNIEYLGLIRISPYLLENKGSIISSITLSNILFKISSSYFREGLTLNPYRHLINYIIKEKLNYNINLEEEEEEEEDNIVDLLANRSTKVGNLNYSRDLNLSFSTTKDIYNRALRLCLDYFRFFNIDKFTLNNLEESLLTNNNLAKLLISSNITSLDIYKDNLDIKESLDIKTKKTKKLEEYLREFYNNPTLTFKDNSITKGLDLILSNTSSYITYINKTGSGKSLLFLLPTFINNNIVNIVLTPRISLKEDLYKRAKEKNLEAYLLEDINLEESIPKGLIITNIDNILDTKFNTYINLLRLTKLEIKIYLDEIHCLILESNYRPILKYINSLLKFKFSIIFITATLPSSLLNILNKEFFLDTRDNIIIRGSSNREDISYNIILRNNKIREEEDINNIIDIFRSQGLDSSNKALIFVNSTTRGLNLSSLLSIDFYYSNNPNKDNILKVFLEPNNKSLVLITTSALGLGIDFNIIKYTLHLTPLYSLLDYIQESSRIRNKGYSYILSNIKPNFNINYRDFNLEENNINTREEFKALDKAYITKYLNETKCLRRVISKFLDNNSSIIDCNFNKELACSICYKRQELVNNKALLEESSLREVNLGLVNLEEKLKELNNICLICLLLDNYKESLKHNTNTCFNKNKVFYNYSSFSNIFNTISKNIKTNYYLKDNSNCFTCLLPPRICFRLKEESNTNKCLYSSLTLSILSILILRIKESKSRALYNNPILDNTLSNLDSTKEITKDLISPSFIYKTDPIKIINIIDNININSIIIEREIEIEPSTKSTKRPRTPPNTFSNLIISPNPRDKKK
jgi:superfamily II DNA helicase RecQ